MVTPSAIAMAIEIDMNSAPMRTTLMRQDKSQLNPSSLFMNTQTLLTTYSVPTKSQPITKTIKQRAQSVKKQLDSKENRKN